MRKFKTPNPGSCFKVDFWRTLCSRFPHIRRCVPITKSTSSADQVWGNQDAKKRKAILKKCDQFKHRDTITDTHRDTVSRRRAAVTPDEEGACRNNKCGVTGNLAACGGDAAVVWAGSCPALNKHTSNCPSGTDSRCGCATVSQSSAKHEIN